MIAALYVLPDGPYSNLPWIDPWDEKRDARNYAGPHRVIAHPPCERWERYWSGGPSAKVRRTLGDDNGCFAAALESVRKWGGVLEHPEASHAFRRFGLRLPDKKGQWWPANSRVGEWVCCVEQGHYGHPARKATWLFTVDCDRPELIWGPAPKGIRLDQGFHSKEERDRARRTGVCQRLSQRQRKLTPTAFRDLLISIVEGSTARGVARSAIKDFREGLVPTGNIGEG